jgi:acyl-coenzyme A synthetase/AMP-(fatty) acid ligase
VQLEPVGEVRLRRFGLDFREVRVSKSRRCLRPDGRGGLVEGPAGGVRDFRPGDLLALAPSGHVIFAGRANDVFLFQGQMVSPYEIEDALREAPEVADCAGFGAPSATYGAVPMAAVVLREGVADPLAAAERLRQRSRERLGHRSAKKIVVMEELPRGAGGKPLRRLLAERHALRL